MVFASNEQIVLNVRCGLGLLAMTAAKAGAKHVYAIDKSQIVDLTRKVVYQNGYADRISVIHGNVKSIQLPVDQVDIIISPIFG